MRVWLDDVREMPNGFDAHVRTAEEAIKLLASVTVTHISFDHDLGFEMNGTGYDVAKWIEAQVHFGTGAIKPLTWAVHSANPVGRDRITSCMRSVERFWDVH